MICSLKLNKDFVILKCCCGFCAFGFEAMPHPSCYLTPIMAKTHLGPVIALFSVKLQQIFSYAGGILVTNHFSLLLTDRYPANYNTRGAFAMHFLICIDLLNCFRSLGTVVTTTERG